MGGVSGELPLGGKACVKSFQHPVERFAELPEFRQDILGNFHIREIVRLYLLHLGREGTQGLEGMTAEKIRKHAAEHRHCNRDVPAGGGKGVLRSVNDDGQLLIEFFTLRVEKVRFALVGFPVVGHVGADGVHIAPAGIAEQKIHGDAGRPDEKHGHQSDAPLQGQLFHGFDHSFLT